MPAPSAFRRGRVRSAQQVLRPVHNRNPGEVSFYLGLATAIATFSAAAVGFGLLNCAGRRERVAGVAVLLFVTLGIGAALATVARGRTSGVANVLIGAGVFTSGLYVLVRALQAIFTVRAARSPATPPSSTQALPVVFSTPWTAGDRSGTAASGAGAGLFGASPGGRLLRGPFWATLSAFFAALALALTFAFPDLFEGFLRSHPIGGAATGYRVNGTCWNHTCVLYERRAPSRSSDIVARLPEGQQLKIACQTRGARVKGPGGSSSIWNRLNDPRSGPYVSDYFTTTPAVGDFTKGIARCPASAPAH
jgi:hypothetical protein